ncbi:MAG: aminopeptidase, partial [Candidatus Diapherotrites archaeon]|nr:aminopeptidase [Candidatus Diapherotrites archaeon]
SGELDTETVEECQKAEIACNNANICRDLVNDNSSTVNPDYLEKFLKKHCKQTELKISVLHEKQLKRLGMELILAVGRGSESRPRLIIIEYNGNNETADKFLFVGKGITFDSGGLDLKPGESMQNMRDDMAGAAAVFGLLKTCAEQNLKKNVVGILGLAENLIDAKSYRQGDVYASMKGLTVENISTDAEGRLVLADCIYYSVTKFRPKLVVDFSTLTGSAIRTFGDHTALLCATDDLSAQRFFDAGIKVFERVWRMPMFEEYVKETKSLRADLRSLNKKGNNGAIFAACFLNQFTENTPFVHIDIAGTAFIEDPKPYLEAGATGFGVRLAAEFLKKNR